MVDRKHARTHGLAGGGGKRLRLHKQMDGVDGAKLWPNQKADKGEKIAFFHRAGLRTTYALQGVTIHSTCTWFYVLWGCHYR